MHPVIAVVKIWNFKLEAKFADVATVHLEETHCKEWGRICVKFQDWFGNHVEEIVEPPAWVVSQSLDAMWAWHSKLYCVRFSASSQHCASFEHAREFSLAQKSAHNEQILEGQEAVDFSSDVETPQVWFLESLASFVCFLVLIQ